MNLIALKMLIGDRAKYFAIVFGVAFATLLMAQQLSIFIGLMTRTYAFIADTGYPQLWVMNDRVEFVDDIKPMKSTTLQRVRGIEGVGWAVPMYKGLIKARTNDGTFENCFVIGLDDTTLIGGPPQMIEGSLDDLRKADGVIVDIVGATEKLRVTNPDGTSRPLRIGDSIELNDQRAVVVGLCQTTRSFNSQPSVYTTYSRATTFAPRERNLLSFVLVGIKDGFELTDVQSRINQIENVMSLTQWEFSTMTYRFIMNNTGIPINFGISVVLGIIIGTAIVGQTLYAFTIENMKYLGALKAMGCGNATLIRMTLLQAVLVAIIGYGIGMGLAALFGYLASGGELAFRMVWQIPVFVGGVILVICLGAALLSLKKVILLEPGIVFRG